MGLGIACLLDAQAKAQSKAATGERDGCGDPDRSSAR
jgi:hypothetical protein